MEENITGEQGSCKSIKCIEGKFKQRAIRPWAKLFYRHVKICVKPMQRCYES